MAKVDYNINLDLMLENISAGQERENAAISLDKFLGIPHIPTEGFGQNGQPIVASVKSPVVSSDSDDPVQSDA